MTVNSARLGSVLELQRRAVDVDLGSSYVEVGVRSFGRGIFLKDPTPGLALGEKRVFHVNPRDLIVSNVFAWEGAIGVAGPEHEGSIGSHRFMTWTPTGDVDVAYVAHYLLCERGMEQLRQASPGSAGRNRTLSIKNFEAIEVPLPELAEQRRIAAQLHAVADALFVAARLAVDVQTRLPPSTLPRVVALKIDSEDLPVVKVRDLVDSVNDTIHPGDDSRGAVEFVGLEHIESHTGRVLGGRPVGDETGRKFRFAPGDITYGYLRPYLNKVWVADRRGLCSVEQFVLRPRADVNARLMGHALRSAAVLEVAIAATNRLQLPRLRLETLMDIEVPDVREGSTSLALTLDDLRDRFVRLETLRAQRAKLIEGVLPAARNEIFSAMR